MEKHDSSRTPVVMPADIDLQFFAAASAAAC
jgi:hypothetical protein